MTENSVPKGVWLKFSARTNAPYPYEIRWQVVNTGREAIQAGQLRGDFYMDDDGANSVPLGIHRICRHTLGRSLRHQERRLHCEIRKEIRSCPSLEHSGQRF